MNKDLVVTNNDSNQSSDSSEDLFSLNKNSFNHLSKTSNNTIDNSEESPNFNESDDYEKAWNSAEEEEYSSGNFYNDDSNEYYRKGSVYKNDYTEDFPNINNEYINKLHKDLKKYKNEDNNEDNVLKNLTLTNDTSHQFFDIAKDEVVYESGKVLFKSIPFELKNNRLKNLQYFRPVLIPIVLWLILRHNYLILTNFVNSFFVMLILTMLFLINIILIVYTIAKIIFLKHYLVLDYDKKEFYQETRSFFKSSYKNLFKTDDVVQIGTSYEYKYSDSISNDFTSVIYFLLKNGKIFKFKESDSSNLNYFSLYNKISKYLSYAIKIPAFENKYSLKLYKSIDENNNPCLSTKSAYNEDLSSLADKDKDINKNKSSLIIDIFTIITIYIFVLSIFSFLELIIKDFLRL